VSKFETYFSTTIPAQYTAALADAAEDVRNQPELTITYVVGGENGGVYGLRTKGAELEYVAGGIDPCDMRVQIEAEQLEKAIAQGVEEAFLDYVVRGKVDVIKGLKGMVKQELTRADGSTYENDVTFGGQEEPEVTLSMDAEDYVAMMRGELNSQMAFITGKLKFEGSLTLLINLGALAG
jgi:hypothetical protein